MTPLLRKFTGRCLVNHARHANSAADLTPLKGVSPPLAEQSIDFDTKREDNPDMDASQGITVYAVEHGRRTEVLFTTDALAREYIAARVAAARHYARLSGYEISDTTPAWMVVTYQLWSTVPVVPRSLNTYDDVPGVGT